MSANKAKHLDYKTLSPNSSVEDNADGYATLKPPSPLSSENHLETAESLKNPRPELNQNQSRTAPKEVIQAENLAPTIKDISQHSLDYAGRQKQNKRQKASEKDFKLLGKDRWLARNGHSLTYVGIFLFTFILYFRPYELIPALSGLDMMAEVIALTTLLIYLPTQIANEGSPSAFTMEVKCILILVACSILSIPIAKDPALAWKIFSENFIKVVLIFVVLVNVLQTKRRLKGLMLLAIAICVWLSYQAILLYSEGVFKTNGYRVSVDFGGMFGNPNDMATFLVTITPISIALGLGSKYKLSKLVYFTSAGLMITGNFVTQSRGAFLGLIAMTAVLVWKLGRKQRFKSVLITLIVGTMAIIIAPGNYGLRMLSIFDSSLDQSGSSDQRRELLIQSIWVTLRNPLGIGIGNFKIVGIRNLETHNAFTQISSEIGLVALAAYVILMVSPLRKLSAIERQTFAREEFSWVYYLSIGVQASIITYMVSSFFAPIAYNWHIYYLVAYAVGLRRIYQIGMAESGSLMEKEVI